MVSVTICALGGAAWAAQHTQGNFTERLKSAAVGAFIGAILGIVVHNSMPHADAHTFPALG